MASMLNPYLSFRDNAREAMEFYQAALGGDLESNTFGEYGDPDAPEAGLIMHARLNTPAGFTLMGADTPPGMEFDPGSNIAVHRVACLGTVERDEADAAAGFVEDDVGHAADCTGAHPAPANPRSGR